MRGWTRLAIFLAVLISAPIFLVGLGQRTHGTALITLAYDDPATSGEPLKIATLKAARADDPFVFNHCETSNITVAPSPNAEGTHQFLVTCTPPLIWALGDALPVFLFLAAVIAAIVLALGWVVTGFRHNGARRN